MTKMKKRVIYTITIICALCVACILSILIYRSISLHNRYRFCLELAPALEAFSVNDSVASWKNEENGLVYYFYPQGSYRIDHSDEKTTVIYDSGFDCFYQYVDDVLQLISVGYNDGNYHTYNTYIIE